MEVKDEFNMLNTEKIDLVLQQSIRNIEDLRCKNEDVRGVPSGFPSLDSITNGWQKGDLIIIAARPSIGKTGFSLNLAVNAALSTTKPTSVAFFSLEMNKERVVERLLSASSEVRLERIVSGKLEEHEMKQLYAKGIQRLSQAPLFINDIGGLNICDLKTNITDLKTKYDIGLFIIDYLQLMNGVTEDFNREQEISRITRELKALAKRIDTPIIALSQLSREVEKRGNNSKVPHLSDLRDSGAIEQDADIVIFLYRPDYYDIEINEMGEYSRGETHVRIAKNRSGQLDTIKLNGLFHIQKFIEADCTTLETINFPGKWKPVKNNEKAATMFLNSDQISNDFSDDQDSPF